MTGEHGDAKKGSGHAVTRRHGCRLPLAGDADDADARRRGAGARPARGHALAVLAVDPLRADPPGHSAAPAPDRPAAPARHPGAVRAAPPGLGRRPGLRPRRPPQPGQPALARRPVRARRLRGRGHEPPARSGPPALGDARGRGARGGAHGAGGQGAPRHPRRGERRVRAGGLPGPDAADPHCGAAARVGPRTVAVQHADAAPRRLVAGPAARIGAQHAAGRGGGGGRPRHAQPRAGRPRRAVAPGLLRGAAHVVQRRRVEPQALCRPLGPARGREAGRPASSRRR